MLIENRLLDLRASDVGLPFVPILEPLCRQTDGYIAGRVIVCTASSQWLCRMPEEVGSYEAVHRS